MTDDNCEVIEIRVDAESIRDYVLNRIADRIGEQVEARLDKEVNRLVDEQARTIVEAKMLEAVDAVLAAGWSRTNQWGETVDGGKPITLRDRISRTLDAKKEDHYGNRGGKPLVARLCDEVVEREFRQQFGGVMKEAKAKVKAAVDGKVMEQLHATLKSSLGLH